MKHKLFEAKGFAFRLCDVKTFNMRFKDENGMRNHFLNVKFYDGHHYAFGFEDEETCKKKFNELYNVIDVNE